MADAAMTVLLETLSHMLLSCSDLIAGAEDDFRLLRDEVDSFRAFLRNAACSKPKEERPFRETERRIEVAVCAVQDTIDYYMMEAAAARSKIGRFGLRRRVLATIVDSRRAEEVRSLRENEVKPLLDKARTDFPNLILEEPHQIVAEEVTVTVCDYLLHCNVCSAVPVV